MTLIIIHLVLPTYLVLIKKISLDKVSPYFSNMATQPIKNLTLFKMEQKNTQLKALNTYLETKLQIISDTLSPETAQTAMNQVISAVSAVLKMFTLPEKSVNLAFAHGKIYGVPNTLRTPETCKAWIEQQHKESK